MHSNFFSSLIFAFAASLLLAGNSYAQGNDEARKKCTEYGFKDKTSSHDTCMKQFLQVTASGKAPVKPGVATPPKEQADKARKEEEARKLKEKEKEVARELAKAKEEAAQTIFRRVQMQRNQGMPGATGSPDAKGTALRASAPSASYAGKIIEQIKENTTFTDASAGRPWVVVLVKTTQSGFIVNRYVVSTSGNKAWDAAVLRAVDKMATVPRDDDGRIPDVLLKEGLEIKVTL